MTGATPESYEDFEKLVYNEDGARTEKQCQPYLLDISETLCHETGEIVRAKREETSRFGFADLVVSSRIETTDGLYRTTAYVWEVKAPQCFLYEPDDHSVRLRPTIDLVKAENQLLHYAWEFNESRSMKDFYGLGLYGKFVPAGVLIGRRDRLVKPRREFPLEEDPGALFEATQNIRDHYLYGPARIHIRTWDWALGVYRKKMARSGSIVTGDTLDRSKLEPGA
ncbi:hypothetical protein SAE02_61620 [Skermanella aerolata]|uniref:Uncharacterized protein n=1 Tax=Skermanella aerolata TaxID=393310 RepID=A0A512DZV7_9PROT|nr:hypothetical protein [Skermanella aerolata]KJB91879.1 hypothetical protein N826_25520 [Skermanella aerolata KACC 11604]GEO42014.1 hypothetical protein SAE02_61620 [Skermanella aerolata]